MEGVLVNEVGFGGKSAHRIIGSDTGNIILELDNILVGNDALSLRSEERSWLSAPANSGRGSQNGWEKSEKSRQMHDCKF